VLEVRKSLETLAILKACERMTEEDIAAMRQAEKNFEALVADKDSDLTALAEADVTFHDTIYQGTKNRRLIQILANLREQMYRFRIEYLKDAEMRSSLVTEHIAIIEAVCNRDSDKAVKFITEHIDNQQRAINASIEANSEV
jgi:DNA-binding GntR family transcriptional regulator